MKNYSKTPYTTNQIIQKLKDRGLIFSNPQRATDFLLHASYYRLKPYIIPFQDANKSLHNTDFNDIIDLYEFDSKLRFIILETIEKIEVSIRACLVNTYSLLYGTNWYENASLFQDRTIHNNILLKIDTMLDKNKKEQFISHYNNNYTNPPRPPSWMVFEIITLGTLSNIFAQLNVDRTKKNIARSFGLPTPHLLKSWLHTLTYLRNIVAHHSRLWNRTLQIKPQKPKKPLKAWISLNMVRRDRIYLTISCIKYMLNIISPNNDLTNKIKTLFSEYPSINLKGMNFPNHWDKQPLWK